MENLPALAHSYVSHGVHRLCHRRDFRIHGLDACHDYTLKTWLYLLIIHAPVPALMFTFERDRKIKFHTVVCFLCTLLGGLALGFLMAHFLICILGMRYL